MDCDIVLLPEPDIARKAIRTSEELAPLGTEYTLGAESPVPHVSLYMFHVNEEKLPQVVQKLEAITAETEAQYLESNYYSQKVGYIGAEYQKTAAIKALQEKVVAAINPLRDGLRPRGEAKLEHMDAVAQQNLRQYGDWRIGELFRPHLTFTRFKNRLPIPLEDMGAPTAFSGRYPKLALFEMGPNGTCIRKIKEWDLR